VAGDVGFLKQSESGDSAAGKLVPLRIADRVKVHFGDQVFKERTKRSGVRQRGGIAHVCFDNPFTT